MGKHNDFLVDDLSKQLALGNVAIFVGAGVSTSSTNNNPYSKWISLLEHGVERCEMVVSGLPDRWADRVKEELLSHDMDDLLSAAQKIETKLKRTGGEYGRWLEDTIGSLKAENADIVNALDLLKTPLLTTNYDTILEQITGKPGYTWKQRSQVEQVLQGRKPGIVHLHGQYEQPETVVLGIRSYEDVRRDEFVQTILKSLRTMQTLLFVGYGDGLNDPNFGPFFEWTTKVFDKSHYRHFILAKEPDQTALQEKLHPDTNFHVCSYGKNFEDLAPFLKSVGESDKERPNTEASRTRRSAKKNVVETITKSDFILSLELPDYYKSLRETHGFIRFVEMPNMEDMSDIRIESLFVEPKLSEDIIHADRPEQTWPPQIRVEKALEKNKKLVLLGDPGSGKSTLISSMTYQLCQTGIGSRGSANTSKSDFVPIPMILRELKLRADLSWESLLDSFLLHRTGKLLGSRKKIETILKNGKALVMLDGLDEIGNLAVRTRLRDAVHAGMSQYPNSLWILTSRIVGYDEVPFHFSVHEKDNDKESSEHSKSYKVKQADVFFVSPFSDREIKLFSEKWFKQHETDSAVVAETTAGLIQAISSNEGTQRLARIPFLLTLIAIVYRKNSSLPHGRSDLYDRIAGGYLETIDVRRNLDQLPYSLSQKKRWLAEIGYQMQLRRSKAKSQASKQSEILADSKDIYEWLSLAMKHGGVGNAEGEAKVLLDYFAKRSGLLLPRGEGQFAFMHLSLQEYFAACYLEPKLTASRFADVKKTSPTDEQLKKWANDSSWKETFVLLFERLASKEIDESEGLFNHLFHKRLDADDIGLESVSAKLEADLTVDQYVLLGAAVRQSARRECWNWVFRQKNGKKYSSVQNNILGNLYITQLLIAEQSGDLKKAWEVAGLDFQNLSQTLVKLDLSGCRELSNLSIISECKKLEYLSIAECHRVTDISFIKNIKTLKEVILSGCTKLTNIKFVKSLSSLERLDLERCYNLDGIDDIAFATKLKFLSLGPCAKGMSLEPISELKQIVNLIINVTPGVSTKPLAKLKKVKTLMFQNMSEEAPNFDIEPIASMTSLEEIHFHGFRYELDLSPLKHLPNLKHLCTGGSQALVPDELVDKIKNPVPSQYRKQSAKRS